MGGIRIEGLVKSYGARKVLDGLDLTVEAGECFTLLGPSACGKTVLMRLLAGFETPDAGRIVIGDTLVAGTGVHVPPDRRGIGMVFQDYAVWPHMSVRDNVAYPLKIAGIAADVRAGRTQTAIGQVGLAGLEQRMPSQLSGGQQQRVALARALVSKPALLLLDEPLNNLDANLREEMRFEIRELQQRLGITVIYVTHDQEIALALSDRLAVMDEKGCLRQVGAPDALFDRPADAYVYRFLGVANFIPVRKSAAGWRLPDGVTEWVGPLPDREGGHLAAGFRPNDVALSRSGAGLPGIVRRASFLGAQTDYLIEVGGVTLRAATDSRRAGAGGQLFRDNEPCRIGFHAVQWFDELDATGTVNAEDVSATTSGAGHE
ncbi:MAG: ABC transporter ATP-binding protein [Betaproteobacteria bacterium]|nr:ABC transporter ATP-binding protein [Betaproteobacteria bacterium]